MFLKTLQIACFVTLASFVGAQTTHPAPKAPAPHITVKSHGQKARFAKPGHPAVKVQKFKKAGHAKPRHIVAKHEPNKFVAAKAAHPTVKVAPKPAKKRH